MFVCRSGRRFQGARAGADNGLVPGGGGALELISRALELILSYCHIQRGPALELISPVDGLLVGHINLDRPEVLANSKISCPLQSCIHHSTSSHWAHVMCTNMHAARARPVMCWERAMWALVGHMKRAQPCMPRAHNESRAVSARFLCAW